MICTKCGANVPDGQNVCPACGNPVVPMAPQMNMQQPQQQMNMHQPQQQMNMQQPQQMNMQQTPQMNYQQPQQMGYQQAPQMGYRQPQQMGYQQAPQMGYPQMGYQQAPMKQASFNLNGIKSMMNGDLVKMLGFFGALLITLAPFLSWLSASSEYFKTSLNLFGYGKTNDQGFVSFCAFAIFIIGLFLILWEIGEYISTLSFIRNGLQSIPYIEVGIAAVAVILMIICFFNGDLKDAADGDDVSRGIGCLFGIIGFMMSGFANVVRRSN